MYPAARGHLRAIARRCAGTKWPPPKAMPQRSTNSVLMHVRGQGVPQDYVLAYVWFNVAAARSPQEERQFSIETRDKIAAQLSPAQLARAQEMARNWRPESQPVPQVVPPRMLTDEEVFGKVRRCKTSKGIRRRSVTIRALLMARWDRGLGPRSGPLRLMSDCRWTAKCPINRLRLIRLPQIPAARAQAQTPGSATLSSAGSRAWARALP
jgi:hypothetical protein